MPAVKLTLPEAAALAKVLPVVIEIDGEASAEIGAIEQQILNKLLKVFPEIREPSIVEREVELEMEEIEELARSLWGILQYLDEDLRMEDWESVKDHLLCWSLLEKILSRISGLRNVPSQAELASFRKNVEKAREALHAKREANFS